MSVSGINRWKAELVQQTYYADFIGKLFLKKKKINGKDWRKSEDFVVILQSEKTKECGKERDSDRSKRNYRGRK